MIFCKVRMPERGCSRSEQPGAAVAMFSVSVCVERLPDEDARPWQLLLAWEGGAEREAERARRRGAACVHASRRHVEPGRCSGDLTLLHTVGSLAACWRCEARVRACVGASVKMLGHHHRQHRYTCSARGAPLLRGYGRRRGACRSKRVEGPRWRCRAPHRITKRTAAFALWCLSRIRDKRDKILQLPGLCNRSRPRTVAAIGATWDGKIYYVNHHSHTTQWAHRGPVGDPPPHDPVECNWQQHRRSGGIDAQLSTKPKLCEYNPQPTVAAQMLAEAATLQDQIEGGCWPCRQ